jgi:hypothetical protein
VQGVLSAREEGIVKKLLMGIGAALWISALAACVVTGPGPGGGACEALSCAAALSGGLQVQGDALCDATSDSLYTTVLSCACGAGTPCDAVCGDNICVDQGETPDCGDCLNQNCPQEHTDCAND